MKTNLVELFLTCVNQQEAQMITDALLEKKLMACVEQMEIRSKNWWQGSIEDTMEIKLSMLTVDEKYEAIETIVRELHSYETFVLKQLPLDRVNDAAAEWLHDSTK